MKRSKQISAKTDLYAGVKRARMNERDREVVLNALGTADAIVDAIQWVVNGAKHLVGRVFEKPVNLKHSH